MPQQDVIATLSAREKFISMCFYSGAVIVATEFNLYELVFTEEGYKLHQIQISREQA